MDLIQRRQQDAQQEHGAGGLDVPPNVLQEAKKHVRIGIPAYSFTEAREVKEALSFPAIKQAADHPPGHTAAQETTDAADDDGGLSQGGTVEK